MILVRNFAYPSAAGPEKRKLYIYLPLTYEYEPDEYYPVLYMFDGHNVFYDNDSTYGKSWGLGKYLDYNRTPLIVAALECNHGDHNERLSEYSPYSFSEEGIGKVSGKGIETMEILIHRLKPYMDKRFRTLKDRDHTFIAGSSMGGLMSLYAVLKYHHYFSKAAALSPSIFLVYGKICRLAENCSVEENTTIYMDLGSEEVTNEGGSIEGFAKFGSLLMKKGISLTQRIVPLGDHSEASWEKQLPFMIETLLYDL